MTPREHLHTYLQRIRLLTQRYMRRYADRLLQADGSYSDLCVGPQELKRLLGLREDPAGQLWLDRLGVMPAEAIRESVLDLAEALDEQAEAAEVPLPIERLRESFGLSGVEVDLLMAAAAPRLSRDMARLYAVAWSDFSVRQPTAGFLCELVCAQRQSPDEIMGLLSDESPLVRDRLLIPVEHELWRPVTPRLHAPMAVPERVLDFLRGAPLQETGLPGCRVRVEGEPLQRLVLEPETRARLEVLSQRGRFRARLTGPKGAGRETAAQAVAARGAQALLSVDVLRAFADMNKAQIVPRMAEILREARFHQAVLLLRLEGLDGEPVRDRLMEAAPRLKGLLEAFSGSIFTAERLGSHTTSALLGDVPEIELRVPGAEGQRVLWERALEGAGAGQRAVRLAAQISQSYRLPPGAIARAVERAAEIAHAGGRSNLGAEIFSDTGLLDAVRRQFDHDLGWLAEVIATPMRYEDVVLSEEVRGQLQEVLLFARHADTVFRQWGFERKSQAGAGLSVMFSGPPGTGKTLMAGALARELGRVLYRVDLSRVVDKYIGETEKNLGRVFDEAERAQAVLLFDEADSLFAKRTAVKSSNDRYANLEVNFLLQRLEAYSGVSILTTNFATSIDEAFQRRIRFKIEFPMPTAHLRASLWRTLLPPGAPVGQGIDWAGLGSRFEFTGGHIRNAVLRAAMHAAEAGSEIVEAHLHRAGLAESREMGQLIVDGD